MVQSGGVSVHSPRPQSVGYCPPPNGIRLPDTLNNVCYDALSQDLVLSSMVTPFQEDQQGGITVDDRG